MLLYLLPYRELFICHILTASSISKKTLLERIFLVERQDCYTKDTKGLILCSLLTLLSGREITPICTSICEGGISQRILIQSGIDQKEKKNTERKHTCNHAGIDQSTEYLKTHIISIWRLFAFWGVFLAMDE